jgi:ribosomal protein L27
MKQTKNSVRKDTSKATRDIGVKTLAAENVSITEALIRRRASEIHQARGGAPGQELNDWLQAEREVKAQMQIPPESNESPKEAPLRHHENRIS